ncbi:peptidoglycan DD-metalloendopeptidase family protein [Budvicia diplopodorum]|uniref:peptidoglycan DD-metalloendopeptidase family protein n=1 Tax=Budvicia diplopodorum TaxID=1119056 RepID=UPI001FE2B5B8|nr:peptidoglycan DD-metalloendopeptidase family protein [Budvicia diplopodorum]
MSGFALLRYPTAQPFKITSEFNPHRVNPVTRRSSPHEGIDFSIPIGSAVVSTGAGEVVIAKFSRSAGNYIVIKHADNYQTQYMHLSKLLVKEGQNIKQGQQIALSGNSGRSTGPHLHYELLVNNKPVNPLAAGMSMAENFDSNVMLASQSASPFSQASGAFGKGAIPNYRVTNYTSESTDYMDLDESPKATEGKKSKPKLKVKGNQKTVSTSAKTTTKTNGKYKVTVNTAARQKKAELATASNGKKGSAKGNKPQPSGSFQALSASVGDFQPNDFNARLSGGGVNYTKRSAK